MLFEINNRNMVKMQILQQRGKLLSCVPLKKVDEYLPESILEEIFSYSLDLKNLRLVSKLFRDVIDNSLILMSNYKLNVSNAGTEFVNIKSRYQKLTVKNSFPENLKLINDYKLKDFIKSIDFVLYGYDMYNFIETFHKNLSFFNNLHELKLDITKWILVFDDQDFDIDIIHFVRRRFSKLEFENLKSLTVDCEYANQVLYLFNNAPNLKKISITSVDFRIVSELFNWKLDEVCLNFRYPSTENGENCLKFLETQKSTLKVLEINHNISVLNKIIQKFPHLEELSLSSSIGENFSENDSLLSNDVLKQLLIINSSLDSQSIVFTLEHYKYIEKLYIDIRNEINFENLEMPNLKHLTVSKNCFGIVKTLKMKNLKSLTLLEKLIDLHEIEEVPAENLKNIEELKICIGNLGNISMILGKYPSLRHLYLMSPSSITEVVLQDIIKGARQLTSISIIEELWKLPFTSFEFLSQVQQKLIIKFYPNYKAMVNNSDLKIINNILMSLMRQPTILMFLINN